MWLVETFKAGGVCMWPLLACALTGIAVLFERMIVLHRMPTPIKAEKQLDEVESILAEGGLEGCAIKVSKGKGFLNYIYARLLKRYDMLAMEKKEMAKRRKAMEGDTSVVTDPVAQFLLANAEMTEFRDEMLMTIEDSSRDYVSRFLPALNTIGSISTLLGLLGTITGMIKAFNSIAASGTGDPRVVAAGISEALITTATGLFIAVPAVVGYRYLGHLADKTRLAVEVYAVSFSNTLLGLLQKE